MDYLAIIYGNARTSSNEAEWAAFFAMARASGLFSGGSKIGPLRHMLGAPKPSGIGSDIVGYMTFTAERRTDLLALLDHHPVIMHGGSIELIDLPRS